MSRLDEIKERYRCWSEGAGGNPEQLYDTLVDNAAEDIGFLLEEVDWLSRELKELQ